MTFSKILDIIIMIIWIQDIRIVLLYVNNMVNLKTKSNYHDSWRIQVLHMRDFITKSNPALYTNKQLTPRMQMPSLFQLIFFYHMCQISL